MSGGDRDDRESAEAARERLDALLDAALAATFPASDAIAIDAAALRARAEGPLDSTVKRPTSESEH